MNCPVCFSNDTRVTCTVHSKKFTKRYCRCLSCDARYRTIERYQVTKPGPPKGQARPGKVARGSEHGSSILTEKNVLEMRRKYAWGATLKTLSTEYGMSASYISRIVNRKVWIHI